MSKKFILINFIIILLLVGCSDRDLRKENAFSNQMFTELQADNNYLNMELKEKEELIVQLQQELERFSFITDLAAKQADNITLLYGAIKERKDQFPIIVMSDESPLKKQLLESIDYKDPKIELNDNELILFSGILEDVNKDTKEVLIELAVYQHFEHQEDISPPKQMFIRVKKDNSGEWNIDWYGRSN